MHWTGDQEMKRILDAVYHVVFAGILGAVIWHAVSHTAGAQGGGFPSFPTFQGVAIQSGATSITGPIAGEQYITANGTPTLGLIDTSQAVNSRIWTIHLAADSMQFGTCPDSLSGCSQLETLSSTGVLTTTGNSYPAFFRFAYAAFTGVGSCAVVSSNPAPVNVSACSRSAAGTYTVTLSASFTAVPVCVSGAQTFADADVTLIPTTATNVNVSTGTLAAAADANWQMLCVGI
jgi:hypothetical protein